MALCPPLVVDHEAPPPRPYGLYSVAPPRPDNRKAGCGVTYEALCGTAQEADPPCPPGESPPEPKVPTGPTLVEADSFPVYALYECPAVGLPEPRAIRNATDLLALTEERVAEQHLWDDLTIGLDESPPESPGDGLCAVLALPCDDICYVLGHVEAELAATYPGVGVLHVPRALQSYLADGNMLIRNGPRLETPTGIPIVLGAGYTTQPDGTAWIVGTGRVHVYRTPAKTTPTFGTRDNLRFVLAERQVSVSTECPCAAAQVTICDTTGG